MARRAREICESVSFRPPSKGELETLDFGWVTSISEAASVSEASELGAWMFGLGDKRMRLADCKSKEEFVAKIIELDSSSSDRHRSGPAVSMDKDIARKAFFDYPLQDEDILEELWRKVVEDYETWINPGSKYVSPMFAVVQSSGWGKSRLVYELHRKGLYIIYVSCMNVSAAGLPGRTPLLADWISNKASTALTMAAFLIASIEVLAEFVTGAADAVQDSAQDESADMDFKEEFETKSVDMDAGVDDQGAQGTVAALVRDHGARDWILKQTHPELGFPFATKINDKLAKCVERLEKDATEKRAGTRTFVRRTTEFLRGEMHAYQAVQEGLKSAIQKLPLPGVAGPAEQRLKVMFCFDEASTLADTELDDEMDSGFTLLRRVLGKAGSGLWAVMLGTNSRLSNFAPSKNLDPTRKVQSRDFKLFKPFWLTGTAASSQPVSQPGAVEDAFRLGRPMWRAYVDAGYSPERLVGLAREKLNLKATLDDAMVIGVLGCTIGVEVAWWAEVAEVSMAYHMMTASWISDDGRRIHVCNAAEPVLASAAAKILLDDHQLCTILASLSTMCKEGVVTGGPLGEMVTRLVVLLAMLRCLQLKSVTYISKVTLGEFLTMLLGKVPDGLALTVDLTSTLQFNSFSPTTASIDALLLEECFNHFRALTCKPGPKAVDNVLPTSSGYIGVQAKRWQNDNASKMEKAVRKLEAGVDGVDFMLGLVFQLGSPLEEWAVKGCEEKTLVISGLSTKLFPFLSSPVVDALREVLKLRTYSHVQLMTDTERGIVRRMLPLLYR